MTWRDDPWRRWGAAIAVAFVAVASGAVLAKQVVEGLSDLRYVIHWSETVPPLVLLVAYVLQRRWRPRAVTLISRDAEEE